VSHEQVYGAAVGAQTVVQLPAPAGERWNVTETSGRSELAVADRPTEERSGVPGLPSETATPLKAVEAPNVWSAWFEPATKVAWERPTPPEKAAAASSTASRRRRFIAGPPPLRCPPGATVRRCS
jgi:hypothetical protein